MKLKLMKTLEENVNNSTVELFGNRRVIVMDCKCVLDYSKDSITLDLGNLCLKINGENLVADSFVFGQTDITGEIRSLEFR